SGGRSGVATNRPQAPRGGICSDTNCIPSPMFQRDEKNCAAGRPDGSGWRTQDPELLDDDDAGLERRLGWTLLFRLDHDVSLPARSSREGQEQSRWQR
ncbi:hypothetical protein, partial [Mesorhizobium sp. M0036]|uniref:hypothetical protein n=1 Tax=Mesorhizobium sp. M0036 TaxID=2956853 RepID=UPI0033387EFE